MCYITMEEVAKKEYAEIVDKMLVYSDDGSAIRTEEGYIFVKFSEIEQ